MRAWDAQNRQLSQTAKKPVRWPALSFAAQSALLAPSMIGLPQFGPSASHFRQAIRSLAASSGLHALILASLAIVAVQTDNASTPRPLSAAAHFPLEVAEPDAAEIDGSLWGATDPQHADRAAIAGPIATSTDADKAILLPTPLAIDRTGIVAPSVTALQNHRSGFHRPR